MRVDLRSDTVTRPSDAMMKYIGTVELGDDVFGEDPTVNQLEEYAAEMFGFEAALFCTSGTQSNQIAIKVHTNPGEEVICHEDSHVYRYEGGGMMINSGVSVRLMKGDRGRINPDDLEDEINPDDIHYPITKLVSIEDTSNRGGGAVYNFENIKKIRAFCDDKGLKLHLDGARVFNALIVNGIDPKTYGEQFDSISICLSKGLGAPVGSVLLGNSGFIAHARRVRKYMGGGMRQAGIIAGGGLFALQYNLNLLKEDHRRAKDLGIILIQQNWVKEILPVETNIVVAVLTDDSFQNVVITTLKGLGILCVPFGKGRIRMVTHLDFTDDDLEYIRENI